MCSCMAIFKAGYTAFRLTSRLDSSAIWILCAEAGPYLKNAGKEAYFGVWWHRERVRVGNILVRLVIQTGCSPHQAHNQSYVSDVACLQQVENIVMRVLGLLFLLILLFLQDRKPHVVPCRPFFFLSLSGCGQRRLTIKLEPSKMISGTSTLFILAAFLSMASASAIRPWDRSQRGDSGINLPRNSNRDRL